MTKSLKPGKNVTEVWLDTVRRLTGVTKITINLNLEGITESSADSAAFSSIMKEVLDALRASSGSGATPSLQLNFTKTELSPSSQVWKVLLAPFALYTNVSIYINQWRQSDTASTSQDSFHIGETFDPSQHCDLKLAIKSSYDIQVAAATRCLSNLDLEILASADYSMLGECLDSISGTLETIFINTWTSEHPKICLQPISFPRLKSLIFCGRSFPLFSQFAENFAALPALQRIDLAGDIHLDGDATLSVGANPSSAAFPQSLRTIVALDERLPSACQKRRYCLDIFADPTSLNAYLVELEPLAIKGRLDLLISIDTAGGTQGMHISEIIGLQRSGTSSMNACSAAIISLTFTIDNYKPTSPLSAEKPELSKLEHLQITTWYTRKAQQDTQRTLSHFSAPKLVTFTIESEMKGFENDFKAVTKNIPTWPLLENIDFRVNADHSVVIAGKEFKALLEACVQKDIELAVGCSDGEEFRRERIAPSSMVYVYS